MRGVFAREILAYKGTCLGSALRGRWRPVYSLLEDSVVGWAQVGELEETGGFGKKWLYWKNMENARAQRKRGLVSPLSEKYQ